MPCKVIGELGEPLPKTIHRSISISPPLKALIILTISSVSSCANPVTSSNQNSGASKFHP